MRPIVKGGLMATTLLTSGTDAWLDRAHGVSRRRQELLAAFPGEWVAVSDDFQQVYAHGPSYLDVCERARVAGVVDPLLTRLL
jgi:hypothetical protein